MTRYLNYSRRRIQPEPNGDCTAPTLLDPSVRAVDIDLTHLHRSGLLGWESLPNQFHYRIAAYRMDI